jgi:hypothetical protein
MNDKQRLDAYVLAAMTGMVGNVSLLSASTTEYGYKQIYKFAKGMLDYVDEQSPQVQPEEDAEGWILNTGTKPENISSDIEIIFRDGQKYINANSSWVRWSLDPMGQHIGDVIKWRKAQ